MSSDVRGTHDVRRVPAEAPEMVRAVHDDISRNPLGSATSQKQGSLVVRLFLFLLFVDLSAFALPRGGMSNLTHKLR